MVEKPATQSLACRYVATAVGCFLLAGLFATGTSAEPTAIRKRLAADPIFQRCLGWMLDGHQGAFLEDVCLAEFDIPPPSVFLCARKLRTGFASESDREGCALLFDEQARRARAGFLR